MCWLLIWNADIRLQSYRRKTPLACTCWSRLWHTHPSMERDTPILSHPQILSLVYSGILPTFTCFSLTGHTVCPVGQEKYGERSTLTLYWNVCLLSRFPSVTKVWLFQFLRWSRKGLALKYKSTLLKPLPKDTCKSGGIWGYNNCFKIYLRNRWIIIAIVKVVLPIVETDTIV